MKSLALFPLLAVLATSAFGASPAAAPTTDPSADGTTTNTSEATGPKRFWQATLPGGSYMVAIDRISSISEQTYMLDGAVVVHEVDIDTMGQALARFYYIEPPSTPSTAAATLVSRGQQALDEFGKRTGNDSANMVTKKYPETTHAKCIEFRLADQTEIDALLKSVKNAWLTGIGVVFTVK